MNKNSRIHYQSEASVIEPAIKAALEDISREPRGSIDKMRLCRKIVNAVLKAQRKHNHEIISEE